MPVQSDNIPLFNYYFIGCLMIELLAILWFAVMNKFRTRNKTPQHVRFFVEKILCPLMCTNNYNPIKKDESTDFPVASNNAKSKGKLNYSYKNYYKIFD